MFTSSIAAQNHGFNEVEFTCKSAQNGFFTLEEASQAIKKVEDSLSVFEYDTSRRIMSNLSQNTLKIMLGLAVVHR